MFDIINILEVEKMIEDRVISPELIDEDEEFESKVEESSLRPQFFSEYIGQDKIKENSM